MDKTLALLADYNAKANIRFVAALGALEAGKLEVDRGSYYKSLKGLLDHVVGGEFYILRSLATALPGRPELGIPQLKVEFTPGVPAFPAWVDAVAALSAFDAAYRGLATSLTEAELEIAVDMRGTARSIRNLLGSLCLHASHHRAQASQILDEDGVANDFFAAMKEVETR